MADVFEVNSWLKRVSYIVIIPNYFLKIQLIKNQELDYIPHICLDPSVDKPTRDLMGNSMQTRLN